MVRLLYRAIVQNYLNETEIDNFFYFFTCCAQTAISHSGSSSSTVSSGSQSSTGSVLNEETV